MQKLGTKALDREPTKEMLDAARDWSIKKYGMGIGNDAAKACWEVMWDAAKHQDLQ